jgi:tetratricopeptide (TPR) repeat protein
VAFLRRIGVREVIPLNSVPDDRHIDGNRLTRMTLANATGLPAGIRDTWRRSLPEASAAAHPYTPYVATGPLWWLPGQGEWEQLPEKVRRAMACQILRWLKGAWPGDALETGWERARTGYKDTQACTTPLGAFLQAAAWLPMRQPGQGKERYEELAQTDPGRYQPECAAALVNLASDLSALGQADTALPFAREAVAIYQEAARQNPGRFRPFLAASLENLARSLTLLDRTAEAEAARAQAAALRGPCQRPADQQPAIGRRTR